uniref:Uncharacterized protein n=1 Tax=Glossina austeni TaxID=7395 RepID=A0A1A9VAD2_GLOAU
MHSDVKPKWRRLGGLRCTDSLNKEKISCQVPVCSVLNKSLVLNQDDILANNNDNVLNKNVKDNLEKNFVRISVKLDLTYTSYVFHSLIHMGSLFILKIASISTAEPV